MSQTTTASSGQRASTASRNRSARSSSARHASARTSTRRCAGGPTARDRGARRVDRARSTTQVVLARVGGVDVDRDRRRRLRLAPVLRVHPVEVRADGDHHVGLVPQPAGGLRAAEPTQHGCDGGSTPRRRRWSAPARRAARRAPRPRRPSRAPPPAQISGRSAASIEHAAPASPRRSARGGPGGARRRGRARRSVGTSR